MSELFCNKILEFSVFLVVAVYCVNCVCPFFFLTSLCCILQIQKVVLALGDYMNAQCHACIGGTVVREDMRKLEAGVHIVVGTPGRVYDMINRRALGRWFSEV